MTPERLWTLRKEGAEVHAELCCHGKPEWEVVLILEGQRWFGRRHETEALALSEADTFRRGLEAKGWVAAPV